MALIRVFPFKLRWPPRRERGSVFRSKALGGEHRFVDLGRHRLVLANRCRSTRTDEVEVDLATIDIMHATAIKEGVFLRLEGDLLSAPLRYFYACTKLD